MHILVFLYNDSLTTDNLIQLLYERQIDGFEKSPKTLRGSEMHSYKVKLSRKILTLSNMGYVTTSKLGRRTIVSITESGQYLACISGLVNMTDNN